MGSTCDAEEQRQFDFWLGDWEVRDPQGEVVGHNSITRTVGGCGLREEWRGVRGLLGTSLNAWSTATRSWHQTWVDSSGTVLLLEGGIRDGAMVLEGDAPLPEDGGRVVRHRISWSSIDGDPDAVRQHWETSAQKGDWETVFDGRYTRARG